MYIYIYVLSCLWVMALCIWENCFMLQFKMGDSLTSPVRWKGFDYNLLEYMYNILMFHLVNKRLDEWVPEERMDVSKMEFPKKEQKTPKKEMGKSGSSSRPSTPDREIIVVSRRCFLIHCSSILLLDKANTVSNNID